MLGRSLGLDIGSHAIKAVELRQTLRGIEVVRLQALPVRDEEPVADSLRALFVDQHLPADRVVTAIPGDRVTRRRVRFPFRDRRRLAQAVPFEVESEMPFDLEDVFVDWELVGDERSQADVAATVVTRTEVADQLESLRQAGLHPRVLEVEGLVLGNLAELIELPGTRVLLDVGHRKTTLCLLVDGRPRLARTLPIAGAAVTQAIGRGRGVGIDEAERIKHEDGIFGSDFDSEIHGARAAVDRLVRELVRSLGGMESILEGPAKTRVDEITLVGGGARLRRLDEYLAERTGIATARLQVPPGAATGDFLAAGDPLRFAPALALALRGSLRARTHMNFLQAEFAPRVDLRAVGRNLRWTAGLALFALLLAGAWAATGIGIEAERADRLEAELAQLWSTAVPGRSAPRSVPKGLRQVLRETQQRADFLGIYGGNLSALDLLTEISGLMPPNLKIIFEELSIDGQVVRVRGHTPSFGAVDRFKTALAGFPHFSDIRVGDIQKDESRGGNTFSITISLRDAEGPP